MPFDEYPQLPETCDWCGDVIGDLDDAKLIIKGRPTHNAEVVAAFHNGDMPCYGEAQQYGWVE